MSWHSRQRVVFIATFQPVKLFAATNALRQAKFVVRACVCVCACHLGGDKNPVICASRLNVNVRHYDTFVTFALANGLCKQSITLRIRNFYMLANLPDGPTCKKLREMMYSDI